MLTLITFVFCIVNNEISQIKWSNEISQCYSCRSVYFFFEIIWMFADCDTSWQLFKGCRIFQVSDCRLDLCLIFVIFLVNLVYIVWKRLRTFVLAFFTSEALRVAPWFRPCILFQLVQFLRPKHSLTYLWHPTKLATDINPFIIFKKSDISYINICF